MLHRGPAGFRAVVTVRRRITYPLAAFFRATAREPPPELLGYRTGPPDQLRKGRTHAGKLSAKGGRRADGLPYLREGRRLSHRCRRAVLAAIDSSYAQAARTEDPGYEPLPEARAFAFRLEVGFLILTAAYADEEYQVSESIVSTFDALARTWPCREATAPQCFWWVVTRLASQQPDLWLSRCPWVSGEGGNIAFTAITSFPGARVGATPTWNTEAKLARPRRRTPALSP